MEFLEPGLALLVAAVFGVIGVVRLVGSLSGRSQRRSLNSTERSLSLSKGRPTEPEPPPSERSLSLTERSLNPEERSLSLTKGRPTEPQPPLSERSLSQPERSLSLTKGPPDPVARRAIEAPPGPDVVGSIRGVAEILGAAAVGAGIRFPLAGIAGGAVLAGLALWSATAASRPPIRGGALAVAAVSFLLVVFYLGFRD